ncbi:Hypothetical protein Tpal_1102 [Trichococcus palustris]|uniref:Uncharacterized protein n=1 Tax=Trichococcus palustris TaxID=140314 RepID=A0A143YHQ4_9LACT|nr:Hypothetical protein Tpal_1102 [Trichococcus palustris]SFL11232.1 hypothetical protein SAMN04488076_12028 [Trichococcus palustris]
MLIASLLLSIDKEHLIEMVRCSLSGCVCLFDNGTVFQFRNSQFSHQKYAQCKNQDSYKNNS